MVIRVQKDQFSNSQILDRFFSQFLKAAVKREEKQACLSSPEREQARPQVNDFERSDP